MCQQGQAEIEHCISQEKEEIHRRYEAYERGEVDLTGDELKDMAVRMLMLKDMGA